MRKTASHSIYLCSRLEIDQSGHVFLPLVLVSKSFMPKQTREKRLERKYYVYCPLVLCFLEVFLAYYTDRERLALFNTLI